MLVDRGDLLLQGLVLRGVGGHLLFQLALLDLQFTAVRVERLAVLFEQIAQPLIVSPLLIHGVAGFHQLGRFLLQLRHALGQLLLMFAQ